jgi:hypothetical protein
MVDSLWKPISSAPKDGTRVLLFARLNTDGAKLGPVVGYWHTTEDEWRLEPHDTGTELMPTYWMEIPKIPTGSAAE